MESNYRIRDREIRVIDSDGSQLGIMNTRDALRRAQDNNLDLVKISPNAVPPVCKIMDFGKFKYEQSKKDKEVRKNQQTSELKEITLSMTIEDHDLKTKAGNAYKFLSRGDKCKVTLRMRGRQQAHAKIGLGVMEDFFKIVEEVSIQEKRPTIEGRNIIMILIPNKTAGVKAGSGQPQAKTAGATVSAQGKPVLKTQTETAATTSIGAAIKSAETRPKPVTAKPAAKTDK